MAFLPIAVLGAGAFYAASMEEPVVAPQPRSVNQRASEEHNAVLQENGATVGPWQSMSNKQVRMGAPLSDIAGVNFEGGGCPRDPNADPLQPLFNEHVALSAFDRVDTELALYAARGEVRSRRQMPISSTLTPEIHHPNDETRTTSNLLASYMPNFPNRAQIRVAQRMVDSDDPRLTLRDNYGVEYFTRAPGQSFRYE
jgi:hypothetical protein